MTYFIPFAKASTDEQIVYGIASTAIVDDQPGTWEGQRYDGDVVDPEAIREALQGYWGNIREMHGEGAAGRALDILVEGETTYLVAKVVDTGAWAKVKERVYKGFSIGGRVIKAILERLPDGRTVRRITKLLLTEISLVDRPANPQAAILVYKRHGGLMEGTPTTINPDEGDALSAVGELVTKAAADPTKIVQLIQQVRNEAELAGDLEKAERMTQAIGLLLIADGSAEAGDLDTDMAADEAQDGEDMEMAADSPGEEDDETIAMGGGALAMAAQGGDLQKAGRKIAAGRMAIMKQAVQAYLKVLADAGDEESAAMLKVIEGKAGGLMDGKAMIAELQKAMGAPLATISKAVLKLHEDVEALKAAPAAGGPVARFAGQPVTKRLGQQAGAAPAAAQDTDAINNLKRLLATETRPALIAQYEAQLKALTGS